tara:strand:- start:22309 stop:23022 length:714 start_codon:yes stop_codon:yes gene_type:complete
MVEDMSKKLRLYISIILAVVKKDLRMELRNKEMIPLMVVFALVICLIFGFLDISFQSVREGNMDFYSGVFWISILFASILGFSRSAMIEKEAGGLTQYLTIPVDSSAVFLGKLIPNVLFLFFIQVSVYFFLIVFFRAPVAERYFLLILTSSLSLFGIAAVGTFFSTLSAKTNLKEIFLPILMFPILVPLIIASIKSTSILLNNKEWEQVLDWVKLIVVYDLVSITLASILFEKLLEE